MAVFFHAHISNIELGLPDPYNRSSLEGKRTSFSKRSNFSTKYSQFFLSKGQILGERYVESRSPSGSLTGREREREREVFEMGTNLFLEKLATVGCWIDMVLWDVCLKLLHLDDFLALTIVVVQQASLWSWFLKGFDFKQGLLISLNFTSFCRFICNLELASCFFFFPLEI
ncbi:LOW QUALITY PROTEIN: hypothetical protein NC652_004084 [Populus alba x Populus x berolinensis]|nr:LOW QUALITY PROTEIN: hypothetical protein NC652_004084 [Populus alba x Populus x berolinensis]